MKQAWTPGDDCVLLHVKLTPGANKNGFDSIEEASEGFVAKARVTAAPEKGKANAALIKLTAESLGVAKTSVTLVSGETARRKNLRIEGDPEVLSQKIHALFAR